MKMQWSLVFILLTLFVAASSQNVNVIAKVENIDAGGGVSDTGFLFTTKMKYEQLISVNLTNRETLWDVALNVGAYISCEKNKLGPPLGPRVFNTKIGALVVLTLCSLNGAHLAAWNASTPYLVSVLATNWITSLINDVVVSITMTPDGSYLICATAQGGIYAVDVVTGFMPWVNGFDPNYISLLGPVVNGGLLVFSDNLGCSINVATGKFFWCDVVRSNYHEPVATQAGNYAVLCNKTCYVIEMNMWKTAWTVPLVDRAITIGSSGTLVAITTVKGKILTVTLLDVGSFSKKFDINISLAEYNLTDYAEWVAPLILDSVNAVSVCAYSKAVDCFIVSTTTGALLHHLRSACNYEYDYGLLSQAYNEHFNAVIVSTKYTPYYYSDVFTCLCGFEVGSWAPWYVNMHNTTFAGPSAGVAGFLAFNDSALLSITF